VLVDPLTEWVAAAPEALALLVIGLAAATEYVVPPVPGDTLVAFGMFLGARAELGAPAVLGAATAGAIAGSLAAYAFGAWAGRVPRHRWPAFLRGPRVSGLLDEGLDRFARRPRLWLAANRFIPALRAVFFVAAGMRRQPLADVVVFGGLSALAWNALLLAVAYPAGRHWEDVRALVDGYGRVVLIAVVVALAVYLWRRRGT